VTGTETTGARSPLGAVAVQLASTCSSGSFQCREDAFRVLTDLRCAPAALESAEVVAGLSLPGLGRRTSEGDRFAVSLGPCWWLVDAPAGSAALPGSAAVSAVDVSAQRTPLILSGPAARAVLAHGCSLDLHPDAFEVGASAQTLLAKAGVVLTRTRVEEYRCWVRASYARYLAWWLIDASVEYR
jgi:sarcosine oxidase subunit gamma